MKIFITGGTGFVGSHITRRLVSLGHEITVVSSKGGGKAAESGSLQSLKADTTRQGDWQQALERYDVIINLAGRSIFNYWTESYKKKIYASRIETTRNIVSALPQDSEAVLLSTSAAGYYGNTGDEVQDESNPPGTDFLAQVCRDWEKEAKRAEDKGVRVARMRFGVVLGKGGGAVETMKTPFKLGLGGPIGNGKQWFPWIHIDDLVSAVIFLLNGEELSGAFNFTAPGCVRQKEFAKMLANHLHRPAFMPAPSFIMKTMLGEFGKSLLGGQKTIPRALQENGFVFHYPNLKDALEEVLNG